MKTRNRSKKGTKPKNVQALKKFHSSFINNNQMAPTTEKNGDGIKRNNMFFVPWNKLKLLEGFNDREDYGSAEDMAELAESIYQSGVKNPIKGYKEGEFYVVIVGHRRHKAGEIIKKKYNKTVIYPLITYPVGTTKKDLLLDTLLTNSGKELTPLEKASTVSKLIAEKVTVKDIALALGGVSEVYVKRLARFWEIPEGAKKLVRDGVVSATTVMGFLRNKEANIEEFIKEIEKQSKAEEKKSKKKAGKTAKVTGKKLKKKDDDEKLNSFSEFKRFAKNHNDIFQNKAKQEAFEFFDGIAKNLVTYSQILEFFTGK